MRTIWKVVAGAAVLATALTGCRAAAAPTVLNASASPTTTEPKCVMTDSVGTQYWIGGASAEMTSLGDALESIVDTHPADATGVAFCSHYEGALVFLPTGDLAVRDLVTQAAARHPQYSVKVVNVPNSLQTLLHASDIVMSIPRLHGVVVGVGPNIFTGGLGIILDSDSGVSAEDVASIVSSALDSYKAKGTNIPLEFVPGHVGTFADTRMAYVAPTE